MTVSYMHRVMHHLFSIAILFCILSAASTVHLAILYRVDC